MTLQKNSTALILQDGYKLDAEYVVFKLGMKYDSKREQWYEGTVKDCEVRCLSKKNSYIIKIFSNKRSFTLCYSNKNYANEKVKQIIGANYKRVM